MHIGANLVAVLLLEDDTLATERLYLGFALASGLDLLALSRDELWGARAFTWQVVGGDWEKGRLVF